MGRQERCEDKREMRTQRKEIEKEEIERVTNRKRKKQVTSCFYYLKN